MNSLILRPKDLYEYYGMIGGSQISYSSKGYPSTYLEFALEDIKEVPSGRNCINAVSNAKRAFHFQIESLTAALAIKKIRKKGRVGINERINFLQECGIISPNILRKLNRTRNEVEHEYYIPTQDEAQDYVDIVELFIQATNSICITFPTCMGLELMDDSSKNLPDYLEVEVLDKEGKILIKAEGFETLKLEACDVEYTEWLKGIFWQYSS